MTASLYQRSITPQSYPPMSSGKTGGLRTMSSDAFSKHGLERMHRVLAKHVESGAVPGMVSVVSRRGETHVDVLGDTTRDAIFPLPSMSKPVTATAAMILLEECVLRLDEAVDAFLPELAG